MSARPRGSGDRAQDNSFGLRAHGIDDQRRQHGEMLRPALDGHGPAALAFAKFGCGEQLPSARIPVKGVRISCANSASVASIARAPAHLASRRFGTRLPFRPRLAADVVVFGMANPEHIATPGEAEPQVRPASQESAPRRCTRGRPERTEATKERSSQMRVGGHGK